MLKVGLDDVEYALNGVEFGRIGDVIDALNLLLLVVLVGFAALMEGGVVHEDHKVLPMGLYLGEDVLEDLEVDVIVGKHKSLQAELVADGCNCVDPLQLEFILVKAHMLVKVGVGSCRECCPVEVGLVEEDHSVASNDVRKHFLPHLYKSDLLLPKTGQSPEVYPADLQYLLAHASSVKELAKAAGGQCKSWVSLVSLSSPLSKGFRCVRLMFAVAYKFFKGVVGLIDISYKLSLSWPE